MPLLWYLNSIRAHTYGALAIIRDGSRFPCMTTYLGITPVPTIFYLVYWGLHYIPTFISSYIFLFSAGYLVPLLYPTDCCSD